jgi:hypothetical protein
MIAEHWAVVILIMIFIVIVKFTATKKISDEEIKRDLKKKEKKSNAIIIEVDGVKYQLEYATSWASAMSDIVGWVKNLESGATFPMFAGEKAVDTIRNKGVDPFIKECHKAYYEFQKDLEKNDS